MFFNLLHVTPNYGETNDGVTMRSDDETIVGEPWWKEQ